MPVYEYTCDVCGGTTEAMRPMAQLDAPLPCEHCGSDSTHRALSLFLAGASKSQSHVPTTPGGGCGRCGDPQGPCAH